MAPLTEEVSHSGIQYVLSHPCDIFAFKLLLNSPHSQILEGLAQPLFKHALQNFYG